MARYALRTLSGWLALTAILTSCSTSATTNPATQSLMSQMGGMGSVSKLAQDFLGTSVADPRLSGLMGAGDLVYAQPKLRDQLCFLLGGPCTAALSPNQIQGGAANVTPTQAQALDQNLSSSVGGMGLSSPVQGAVVQTVSPSLPGIVGALFTVPRGPTGLMGR